MGVTRNERRCTPPLEGLRRGGLMGVTRTERICTPPLEGLRRGDAHTNKNTQHTHSLLQVQNRIPQALPPPATEKHRFPSPSPSSYNRWQYAWSTNRSTTPSASRGGPHRSRACSTLGSTASACVARAPPLPKRAKRYLHTPRDAPKQVSTSLKTINSKQVPGLSARKMIR